jgi:hypothetical protein
VPAAHGKIEKTFLCRASAHGIGETHGRGRFSGSVVCELSPWLPIGSWEKPGLAATSKRNLPAHAGAAHIFPGGSSPCELGGHRSWALGTDGGRDKNMGVTGTQPVVVDRSPEENAVVVLSRPWHSAAVAS